MTAHLLTRRKAAGRKHWNPNLFSWKFYSSGRIWGWSQPYCLILLLNQQSSFLFSLPQGASRWSSVGKGKSFISSYAIPIFLKRKLRKTLDDLSVALHVSPWLHETFVMMMWFTLHIISDERVFLHIWRKCIKTVLISHRPLETVTNLIIFHLSFCGWNYNLLISGF